MRNTTNEVNKIHIVDEAGTAQDVRVIEENKKTVEALVLSGSPLSLISDKIFKITEENERVLVGVISAKDAISQYYYNIEYSRDELDKYKNITKKNVFIYNIELEKYANVGYSGSIKLHVKNLSFDGISENDIIYFKFYNSSLNEIFEYSCLVGVNIKQLGEIGYILIQNVPYPTISYEYNLCIEMKSGEYVYSSSEIKGINILGGAVDA